MFGRKSWFSGGVSKPKNLHSLDHLKYLYQVLYKNQVVHEQNKSLLVETLRSIAEILIWGDQNDSTVFDFFLEKNMLSFFLKIMKQKCGSYVCVQLLQTLNILFENIRNETSLYYLLSNNHVNSIIVHKFDFSDEEVMAYYISFLKTLSLKLNTHTIHFFYNEHTNDFPLYTEAIKFFNHGESMVRIAVRTLTLNVFKVDDQAMLKFIRDRTAAPYFCNLVRFIESHVLELDSCVIASDIQMHPKLADLVAEHLDHLHYLNDILCLPIDSLNDVLADHLLNQLLVPLYVSCIIQRKNQPFHEEERSRISCVVSLFLLSQVFLIISHKPLVQHLAHLILSGDFTLFSRAKTTAKLYDRSSVHEMMMKDMANRGPENASESNVMPSHHSLGSFPSDQAPPRKSSKTEDPLEAPENSLEDGANITDEEKVAATHKLGLFESVQDHFSLSSRPFLEAVFSALECSESDHGALFALCLLYALGHNPGIHQDLLDTVLMPSEKSDTKFFYNANLIERLLKIIGLSCQYNSKVRLATLELTIVLLKQLAVKGETSFLQDRHLAAIEQYHDDSSHILLNFYKSEEIFLDMFEDEYEEMKKKPLNVEYLMMDAKLLLPPTGTPMSGVEFYKRLPCGEVERARRAIRCFFFLRDLSLCLQNKPETQLPLATSHVKVNDILDLNNGDLFSCTVDIRGKPKMKCFMVVDAFQLILVESEPKKLGWGVAKFVGFLQDTEVTGDKDDAQCLHITVQRPSGKTSGSSRTPLLAARFIFDDNIRCLAAKQCVTRGRRKARQQKLHQIARLLNLPDHVQPCPSPLRRSGAYARDVDRPLGLLSSSMMHRSMSQDAGLWGKSGSMPPSGRLIQHPIGFTPPGKIPGYATKLRQEETKRSLGEFKEKASKAERRCKSPASSSRRSSPKSRDSSPQTQPDHEEIPLEDLSSRSRTSSRHNSPNIRKKSTSGLPQARISAPPGLCHIHHHQTSTNASSNRFEKEITTQAKLIEDPNSLSLMPPSDELANASVIVLPSSAHSSNDQRPNEVRMEISDTTSNPASNSEENRPISGKVKGAIETI